MSDTLIAQTIFVEKCAKKCRCQSVWISFGDADEQIFAQAAMSAQIAREIAAQLIAQADQVEAQQLRHAGRLA